MGIKLKNLDEQVVVITGATSGIGLVTARMAAMRGAKLVLAARNEDALRQLTDEINESGGEAIYVAADVGSEADVQKIADQAIGRFSRFDTWINLRLYRIFNFPDFLARAVENNPFALKTDFQSLPQFAAGIYLQIAVCIFYSPQNRHI